MKAEREEAGAALFEALSPFHAVQGSPLLAVRAVREEQITVRILFDFGHAHLAMVAVRDDDTIEIALVAGRAADGADISAAAPWGDLVGKSFGWGWLTINQQGFCDGALLSFDGIEPQAILNVAGSSIRTGMASLL